MTLTINPTAAVTSRHLQGSLGPIALHGACGEVGDGHGCFDGADVPSPKHLISF
jgi:hypothetical protein